MEFEKQSSSTYTSRAEIELLVRKFESCELDLADFKHREHLMVALWYLSVLPEDEAVERMRAGLLRFLGHHGKSGYHETMTLFWLKVVRGFLEEAGPERRLEDLANALVEACADSRLIFDYYTKETLASEEARRSAVEPDLKPFDF